MSARVSRGSRLSSLNAVPSQTPSLASIDSAFQLQEYIALLVKANVHDVHTIVNLPGSGVDLENKDEPSVDEGCWIYEQLRRLAQDLTHPLITTLQAECNRQTCPEMKAGEWLYLCVAHGNGSTMEQCCAIDYILHTLDSATALLNNPKLFPSRISILQASYRHFSLLARRLSRIFAHAYFHHREAFEQSEAETALYERFLHLTQTFSLVSAEFLVIPPRQTQASSPPRSAQSSLESATPDDANDASVAIPRLHSNGSAGRKRTGTMLFSGDFVLGSEYDAEAAADFDGQYDDLISGEDTEDLLPAAEESPTLESPALETPLPPPSPSEPDLLNAELEPMTETLGEIEIVEPEPEPEPSFETVELADAMPDPESPLPPATHPPEDVMAALDDSAVTPAPHSPVLMSSLAGGSVDFEVPPFKDEDELSEAPQDDSGLHRMPELGDRQPVSPPPPEATKLDDQAPDVDEDEGGQATDQEVIDQEVIDQEAIDQEAIDLELVKDDNP